MQINKKGEKQLDIIIDEMTNVVAESKDEIIVISEEATQELATLEKKLAETIVAVQALIQKNDDLEVRVKESRKKLSIVSRDFERYTEADIKEIYEHTHELQTKFYILQQEEKILRERRDDLERRITGLKTTVEYASKLGQRVSVILTYLEDDFNKVNETLKTAKEKVEFGLKVIEVQEQERKRLSREIHDGPAQSLANILIRSELVDYSLRNGNIDEALKEMQHTRENIRASLQEVRRIIYDLRPMALDDLGLFPTLKKHIQTISVYEQQAIGFEVIGEERRLDANYEVAIFRLVQEALQNIFKHANATEITIKIEILENMITIMVKDNGDGFDPNKPKKRASFGLLGMQERTEILNGKMKISSKLGKGTSVYFILPLVKY